MTMEWSEGKAIYLQIMEKISGDIAAGVLQPGQRVDSVRELAIELNVNPNTVQRALHELERDGVLVSRRNVGRFVTENPEKVGAMRKSQAAEAAREFCSKMKELGYSREEAEAFFQEMMEEVFDTDVSSTGRSDVGGIKAG